jgi:hypothetical protein
MPTKTPPLVLVVFNRPEATALVFERIRQARPQTLMLIADGPRQDREGEADACRSVRRIVENVSWSCELVKNYSETNMGCGHRIASGIDWVFQNVEEAIILEDDCLPHPTFFGFCTELLERYRDDERVMQISGSNFLFGRRYTGDGYYFSRYPLCWGWATWRRAWRLFDFEMQTWKASRGACLARFDHEPERAYWESAWDSVATSRYTWDYQWALAFLNANGLAATPSQNLVTNIGFGSDATHTRSRLLALSLAAGTMKFPLRHPSRVEANVGADRFTARRLFYKRSVASKAAELVRIRLFAAISRLQGED